MVSNKPQPYRASARSRNNALRIHGCVVLKKNEALRACTAIFINRKLKRNAGKGALEVKEAVGDSKISQYVHCH